MKRVTMSVLFWETKTPAELSERITAGSSHPRIRAKVNSSPVEESHNIGGICGINDGVLENCLNDAEIGYKNVGINIGGIVGNQSGCVIECRNIGGDIFGSKSVGGIFGRFEPYTDISIEDLDRVKDDVNEIRENVKSDIDDSWNNTINDIDSLRDRLNTDINGSS